MTWGLPELQAAWVYSLIKPLRTVFGGSVQSSRQHGVCVQEIVPEYQQLGIVRPVTAEHQDSHAGYPARQQVGDLEERPAPTIIAPSLLVISPGQPPNRRFEPHTHMFPVQLFGAPGPRPPVMLISSGDPTGAWVLLPAFGRV